MTDRAGIRILVFVTVVVLPALVVLLQHLPHLLTSPRELLVVFIISIFEGFFACDCLRFAILFLDSFLRLRHQ